MTDVDALVGEVDGEQDPQVFQFGGRSFRLADRIDIRAIAALQRGDINRALVLVLGETQTAELLALDSDEPFDEVRFGEVLDAWARSAGSSLGESPASRR